MHKKILLRKIKGWIFTTKSILMLSFFLVFSVNGQVIQQNSFFEQLNNPQFSNPKEAATKIKTWTNDLKVGLDKILLQETLVSREINRGYERLSMACDQLLKNKDKLEVQDEPKLKKLELSFEGRNKFLSERKVLIEKQILSLENEIVEIQRKQNCNFLGLADDSIQCQISVFKKNLIALMKNFTEKYYELIQRRYKSYASLIGKSRDKCLRYEFIEKLEQTDQEYLVPYERNTYILLEKLVSVTARL